LARTTITFYSLTVSYYIMNEYFLPSFDDVKSAAQRISPHIHHTPIFSSSLLNAWLGHEILFKAECLQKIGAFKARGAINTLKWLQEEDTPPQKIVANSSGNHAQAVAWAAKQQNLSATIFMPANTSKVKVQATAGYGADIVLCENREEVDKKVEEAAKHADVYWIPPYDHPKIIAGQGTAALEALEQVDKVDALFAPCGGGGLLSGCLLSCRALAPEAKVIGVEPLLANDAAESLRQGRLQRLNGPSTTLADGARTPSLGDITFEFIKLLDGFYEVDEEHIIYWTQWLHHLLKLHIEPTCAMTMEGVVRWLATQQRPQRVLVILSGGNIDQPTMAKIWQDNKLHIPPALEAD